MRSCSFCNDTNKVSIEAAFGRVDATCPVCAQAHGADMVEWARRLRSAGYRARMDRFQANATNCLRRVGVEHSRFMSKQGR